MRCVRVVDDHRELVRVESVGAPHDEVADVAREILPLPALQEVDELHDGVADAHALRDVRFGPSAAAVASRHVPG